MRLLFTSHQIFVEILMHLVSLASPILSEMTEPHSTPSDLWITLSENDLYLRRLIQIKFEYRAFFIWVSLY